MHSKKLPRPAKRYLALGIVMLLCMFLLSLDVPVSQYALASVQSVLIRTRTKAIGTRNKALKASGGVRIMPLGDSITYGQGSSTGGGYRLPLWNDLRARGIKITFVGSERTGPFINFSRANEGHPGWTIDQLAAKVVGWLRAYQPQIILLHIGTNDFVKDVDPTHAAARLSNLIDEITGTLPNATLIVAQIIPLPHSPVLDAELTAYNQAIPSIVQSQVARGRHVQYVDMYDAVSASMIPDGIHPNDQGYNRMANVWLNALLPLLQMSSETYAHSTS
jgi:lysophospholipase L1-like esterase